MLPVAVCAQAPGARASRSPNAQTMLLLMRSLLKFIFLNNINL
jgi:hypothetical protein